MKYDLKEMALRTKRIRRKSVPIRDIRTPSMFAGDLFRTAYEPTLQIWSAAIPEIVKQYERTLAESTTDSTADIEGEFRKAENTFSLLSLTITPRIERIILRVESWWRGKWRGAVLSATSVDIGTMIGPSDVRQTLEAAINWNVALVKDVSAEARRRMTSIIYDGLRGNKPAREVAKELRGVVDLGRARATRIASDQLAKLTSTLADERRREAGIDAWKWLHSGKRNGRDEHIARNNVRYTDKEAPAEMPGQLPFCGCRSQALLEF